MKTAASVVVVALMAASAASGYVRVYALDPVRADWSGKAHPVLGVGEIITVAFDLLDSTSGAYCELFAGSRGAGGGYRLSVRTYPGDVEIAWGTASGDLDHDWAKFYLTVDYPGEFRGHNTKLP